MPYQRVYLTDLYRNNELQRPMRVAHGFEQSGNIKVVKETCLNDGYNTDEAHMKTCKEERNDFQV
jgi:hypothetical protein